MIPVEGGGGGCGVRILRKVTRIMIEGFLRGFQFSHCGIFEGKKIWKVPVWGWYGGKGDDAVKFKYVFKGWGGVVQNNLKIGLAYTNWVVLPDKVKPKIVLLLFYLHANFPVTVTFIVSFLLITNLSYVRILSLLSLTVILLKMYVEAYKTSVKLNVKSKVVFFSRYAFFSLC